MKHRPSPEDRSISPETPTLAQPTRRVGSRSSLAASGDCHGDSDGKSEKDADARIVNLPMQRDIGRETHLAFVALGMVLG
jgi:hypothetical protein